MSAAMIKYLKPLWGMLAVLVVWSVAQAEPERADESDAVCQRGEASFVQDALRQDLSELILLHRMAGAIATVRP